MTHRLNVAKSLLLIATVSSLAACAGHVRQIVPESQKDSTGAFDGTWAVKMTTTPSPQRIQDWHMSCSTPAVNIALAVADGVVSAKAGNSSHSTFVNSLGRFRLEIPTKYESKASVASNVALDDGRITLILQGDLERDKPIGKFVVGVSKFGNAGCETKVVFEKQNT